VIQTMISAIFLVALVRIPNLRPDPPVCNALLIGLVPIASLATAAFQLQCFLLGQL
jgi:hypothetical protein